MDTPRTRQPRSATGVVDRAVLAALASTDGLSRADPVQRTGLSGEVAHVQLDVDGPLCGCGNRGCPATNLSAITTVGAVCALHGVTLAAAAALAGAVTLLNPDVLVVDSTLGRAVDAVVSGRRGELVRRCPPAVVPSLRIVPGLPTDPPAAGARALVRADSAVARR